MVDQFTRLRDGDRFFYQNESFSPQEAKLLQRGDTLAKVIEANTSIDNLQPNVFFFKASIGGGVYFDAGKQVPLPGFTVQLEDGSGNVLATTTTDRFGNYVFNQLSGPSNNVDNSSGVSQTGDYHLVLALPTWLRLTISPDAVSISRGNTHVSGLDFGVYFTSPPLAGFAQLVEASGTHHHAGLWDELDPSV
jgi:hypothetical protein